MFDSFAAIEVVDCITVISDFCSHFLFFYYCYYFSLSVYFRGCLENKLHARINRFSIGEASKS